MGSCSLKSMSYFNEMPEQRISVGTYMVILYTYWPLPASNLLCTSYIISQKLPSIVKVAFVICVFKMVFLLTP